MMTEHELFKMELHETVEEGPTMIVTKVVGGWLYTERFFEPSSCDCGRKLIFATSCFVSHKGIR